MNAPERESWICEILTQRPQVRGDNANMMKYGHQKVVRRPTPTRSFASLMKLLIVCAAPLFAREGLAQTPIPQIDPGGPASFVTSLVFSPDGRTLYSGGWDKVVRVWRWQDETGRFVEDPVASHRIPIGPGLNGAINAMALSPDGQWLAVGGRGVVAAGSGFTDLGRIIPSQGMTREMKSDQGVIYLLNTATREVRTLRGHFGEVIALSFAEGPGPQTLVSAARERDFRAGREGVEMGVVRVWDVSDAAPQGKYLAGKVLPVPEVRPVLEAWRRGGAPRDVRVAIAWGDGQLRLWDVARDELRPYSTSGTYDNVLVRQDAQRFIMAHTSSTTGRVALWRVDDAGRVTLEQNWTAAFPPSGNTVSAPRQMRMLGSRQRPRAAAVLLRGELRRTGERDTLVNRVYELRVLDLGGANFATTTARIDLWSGENQFLPALATAPEQGWIAVAGNDAHSIHIYRAIDPAELQQPYQILTSAGTPIESAQFVRRDEQLGLRLQTRRDRGGEASRLLFDVARRQIRTEPNDSGWQSAVADRRLWSVDVRASRVVVDGQQAAAPQVVVQREGYRLHSITGEPRSRVTAYAVAERKGVPLLALATRGAEESQLVLYDLSSGRALRHFTAHTLPVRSLEFSADGERLVSAGEDGFVCVWSFNDLDETLGQRGAPGIELTAVDGQLQVTDVPRSVSDWRPGDVVAGVMQEGRLVAWSSSRDAYDACWLARPGSSLRVRRVRGNQTEEVLLPVVQGTDERKPLFTLFVANSELGGGEEWAWIGFSPAGPYDSNHEQVEQYLGWHINTGQAANPTSFARADQYRQQYRREGVLGELLITGRLPEMVSHEPLPRPNLALSLPQLAALEMPAAGGPLRTRPSQVQLDIAGIEPEQIERVQLVADGEQLGEFHELAHQQWMADLPAAIWTRGSHVLEAVLWTRERTPQRFTATRRWDYVPAAPQVRFLTEDGQTSTEGDWQIEFAIDVESADAQVHWSLVHYHNGAATTIDEQTATGPQRVQRAVTLPPGASQFEVIAVNVGAEQATRSLETGRARLTHWREPEPVKPLVLSILEIRTLADREASSSAQPYVAGTVTEVASDQMELRGELLADRPPTRGTWKRGELSGELKFGAYRADAPVGVETAAPIPLEVGDNAIEISVEVGERQVTVDVPVRYMPPLPELAIISPEDGTELIEGVDEPRVTLTAHLKGRSLDTVRATLMLNGEPQQALDIDPSGQIRAEVAVAERETQIHVRLENSITQQRRDEPIAAVLLRSPPRVEQLTLGTVTDSPFVDLSAAVASALPLTRLEVYVGEERVRTIEAAELPEATDGRVAVQIDAVPLEQGENTIRLFAHNADGRSLQPATATATFTPTPPPRPTLTMLEPLTGTMTTSPDQEIVLLVESKSPLRELRVYMGDRLIDRVTSFEEAQSESDDLFKVLHRIPVTLGTGPNYVRAMAVNDGGQTIADAVITLHPRPVRVEILGISDQPRLESSDWKITPRPGPADVVFDESAAKGRVWLHGRVVWNTPDQRLTYNRMPVHVWVNGFHQPPVLLDAREGESRERTFSVPLVLNHNSGNLIELNLPRLSTEADCPLTFQLDCREPIGERRLHLAIIGIGIPESESEALRQRALAAFQATPVPGRETEFTSKAFQRGWTYGPLTGENLTRFEINGRLQTIKNRVNALSRTDPLNDVIVIYYEGGEIVEDEDQFYLTTKDPSFYAGVAPQVIKQSAIGSDLLSDLFLSMGGAHLMLLDVVRGGDNVTQRSLLPNNRRAALLRYAWRRDVDVPRDARLIAAFGETAVTQGPIRLMDFDRELTQQFTSNEDVLVSKNFGAALIYHKYLPAALSELPLAAP